MPICPYIDQLRLLDESQQTLGETQTTCFEHCKRLAVVAHWNRSCPAQSRVCSFCSLRDIWAVACCSSGARGRGPGTCRTTDNPIVRGTKHASLCLPRHISWKPTLVKFRHFPPAEGTVLPHPGYLLQFFYNRKGRNGATTPEKTMLHAIYRNLASTVIESDAY